MTDSLVKTIESTDELSYQVELSRTYAWEFCLLWDYDFFKSREKALQPIVDAYQFLIMSDREPNKIPKLLKQRLINNPYVVKFAYDPQNVAVSLPPRFGKSYSMSVCNAWSVGKYPKQSILRVSHSQRLYNKFSRHVRAIINDPKFKAVFPGVELSADNQAIDGWSVKGSDQGTFFGSGVGGGIVGMGASLVAVTDDLYKSHLDAMSEAINEATKEWMESAFDSRKEKHCRQFDLGTRWVKDDYIGVKIDEKDYDIVIRIPALDENEKSVSPAVKTTKQYRNTKKRLIRNGREYIWYAEYQQEPIDVKGLLFPASGMKRFRMKDLNMDNCIGKICFVDTADEGTDFYSAPIGYIFPKEGGYDVYVAKVIFTRDAFKYTLPRQVGMINDEEITYTYVETNKEGSLYVNNLKTACKKFKVKGLRAKGQKETRILMEAGYILDMHFLEDDEQNQEYRAYFENLTTYKKEGGNKNDDAPDSTAGLSKVIRAMFKYLLKKTKKNDTDKQEDEESEEM